MLNFKKYAVLGTGKTGLSAVNFLLKLNKNVLLLDTRKNPPNLEELLLNKEISSHFGELKKDLFKDVECIIISPGISKCDKKLESVPKNIPIISDIELFACYVDKPIIAITGTNGKSTVTSLVGLIAKESGIKTAVCGNIGVPALDLAMNDYDLYVLELSSFQLENTYLLNPKIAAILNIASDHLDRYKNLAEYVSAKQRIWHNADICVQNKSYAKYGPYKEKKTVWVSNSPPLENEFGLCSKKKWILKGKEKVISSESLKLLGQHNLINVMTAIAITDSYGIPLSFVKSAIENFPGLSHRCEVIAKINDILWINDSKGSNVAATLASLKGIGKAISGKWVLILGGKAKEHDFSDLISPIKKYCKQVIIFGEAQKLIYQQMEKSALCTKVNNLKEAILTAKKTAAIGDGVLFSPACASFDMFNNFEHRGDIFKEIVQGSLDT